jgi:hypothetical protein
VRKINGLRIEEVDAVGEGLRHTKNGDGGVQTSMNAHCNAFFLWRGLSINEFGGYRGLITREANARKQAKGRGR